VYIIELVFPNIVNIRQKTNTSQELYSILQKNIVLGVYIILSGRGNKRKLSQNDIKTILDWLLCQNDIFGRFSWRTNEHYILNFMLYNKLQYTTGMCGK
jgi:hypothetical protein